MIHVRVFTALIVEDGVDITRYQSKERGEYYQYLTTVD